MIYTSIRVCLFKLLSQLAHELKQQRIRANEKIGNVAIYLASIFDCYTMKASVVKSLSQLVNKMLQNIRATEKNDNDKMINCWQNNRT